MDITKIDRLTALLKSELVPALGCTEPIAIAFTAAKARELLGENVASVVVQCSSNIIKNAKSVYVPRTNGLKGIAAAALIGIYGGDASLGLEVLSTVTDESIQEVNHILDSGICDVVQLESQNNLDIIVELEGISGHTSSARVTGEHTNLTQLIKNGQIIFSKDFSALADEDDSNSLHDISFHDLFEYAQTVDLKEVEAIITRQIDYNTRISAEGIEKDYGINAGSTALSLLGDTVDGRAVAMPAAGSDARMGGSELPVIINSGSGNQGLTASLPIVEYAKSLGTSKDTLYRALVLSNLVAIYQRSKIGRLSAYCGVVNAAAGASAGLTYLRNGEEQQIGYAVEYVLGTLSGMICDGAKASCASKIASSVQCALMGSKLSLRDHHFLSGDGIIKSSTGETIDNVAKLGREGMQETDKLILKIMLG